MMLGTNIPDSVRAPLAGASGSEQRRLKVLSLSSVFPREGAEEYGIFIKRRLESVARQAELKVVSPVGVIDYSQPYGNMLGNRSLPGSVQDGVFEVLYPRWIYPPGGASWNASFLARQLVRPLSQLRQRFPFQLIDAHFGYPDGIAAARLAAHFGIPYMVTLRGNEPMHCEDGSTSRAMAQALQGAGAVVTVSEALRAFAIGLGAKADRVKTIPNGIDGGVFRPQDRSDCRRKHGMGLDQVIVLSAGSLIERKGHHRVIEALAYVRRAGIPARLLIAGGPGREGRFEQEIHAAVKKHGLENAVTFLGQLDPATLSGYMACANLFCLASTREGWPNVVHEAMGCGTAVVATGVGAVPDMLASPERGIMVPAGDQQALNEALERGLSRTWDRERIAAWAHARTWELVGEEVVERMQNMMVNSTGDAR